MEEQIKISGITEFMGLNIPIIEGGFGEGKRCVNDKVISEIHKQPNREIRRRINDNIKRFKEGIDYIDLKGVGDSHTLLEMGYHKASITQAKNIYLLSERGYSKLIKIMDDDKSWEIHDELMDHYFALREEIKSALSETEKAILNIVNAKDDIQQALAIRSFRETIEKPLQDEIDRYERFLCSELSTLSKSELAIKLDTKSQTLASLFKKLKIYTNTSQVNVDFLRKFENIKMITEIESKYKNKSTGKESVKKDWIWTADGAKKLVDYLVELGYVSFCDNKGFKLVKTTV